MSNLLVFRSFPIASFLLFLTSLSLLSALFLSRPNQILAVCGYVGDGSNCDASTPETNEMFCPGSESLYCVGTDSATGQSCPVCVARVGSGTCSNDPNDDDKPVNDNDFNWQFFVEDACNKGVIQPCSGETCSTHSQCQLERARNANVITDGRCGSGTGCNGTQSDPFYRGAKFCIAPTCNWNSSIDNGETGLNCGGGGCPACASLSCAVTSATPTSSTTADATSDDTGGNVSGYDRVDWFLNDGYVGTTAMNTTNGTSSNSFTNLAAGTQYNLGAHYVDTEGGRPAVSCTGYTFQFNPQQTPPICSLSASPQSLNTGGSSTWTLLNSLICKLLFCSRAAFVQARLFFPHAHQ